MNDGSSPPEVVASLLESQRIYYDLRADDYGNPSKPDRVKASPDTSELECGLIAGFRPAGSVLELACGPGFYTEELARYADEVTAVDASPRMLERARQRVEDPKVTFVQADLFSWQPDKRYDAVFFAAWLSHVPPSAFDDFWGLVRACLAPHGRVAFLDEDDRAVGYDRRRSIGGVPTASRTLADGREFDVVKIFWQPEQLEDRLRASGWNISVRRVGQSFLYGEGRPAEARDDR